MTLSKGIVPPDSAFFYPRDVIVRSVATWQSTSFPLQFFQPHVIIYYSKKFCVLFYFRRDFMVNTKLNRSKFFSFLISIIVLLNLTSCENFFADNDLDQKIRAAIDYEKSPWSTFLVSAENNTGTIIPSGTKQYKPTDYYTIEFTLDPNYEFLEWEFQYRMLEKEAGTATLTTTDKDWYKDYIKIITQKEDEDSKGRMVYTLEIQFTKSTNNLLITPRCGKKPLVDEWKPADDKAGVSAQTEIVITFDSELSENSFIYSPEELAQIAELDIPESDYLKNDAGKVYGYKYRNNTIYKSIKIYVEGSDYTSSFSAPSIETIDSGSKKYSRLTLTPTEVLPCPEDETKTAIVSIELENTIVTKENVKITPVKYQYRINSKPLDYSYVDMSGYNLEEGQPNPNTSSFKYAVGKNISLSFKENSAYQFLHWETNNENILFAENDVSLNPTYFYSMNLIRENEKAAIVPVCIARPKFNDIVFKNKYSGKLNPRDEDIVLTFDKAVSIPEDSVITITCTGKGDVTSSFEAPVVNGNTIQITAKKDSSRINVNPGEKFVVTVNIPDTLYYVYHDDVTNKDVNVTIGNTIKEQPSYEIDSTTQNKAALTFRNKADDDAPVMGTLTIDNEKKEDKTGASYDIDKQLTLKFKPNEDYTFLYWTCSNTNVEIKDRFADSTELTVKGAGACSIIPKCAPKLKILSMSTEGNTAKPCDSDIWLETNIKPEDFTSDGRNGNSQTCISVSYNGVDVLGSSYKVPEVKTKDGKTYIYLESINKLSVPHGTTGSVIVKIDGTLYYNYTDADNILTEPQKIEIANGGYSRTFTVSEDTSKKVYVKINSSHVNLDRTTLNDFKNNSDIYVLNEKTEYDLTFTTDDTYQFIKWNVQGTNATPVSIVETDVYGKKYYTLKIAKVPSGVEYNNSSFITVSDDCAEKLAIISCTPQNKTAGVERDCNIEITFNQRPADDIKEKISIKCDGDSVLDSFNLAGATFEVDNSNRPVLIIPANLNKRINVSSDKTKTVKIIVSSDAYYLRSGETEPKITLGNDFEYEYIINHNTNDKAKVLYKVYSNSSLSNDAGTIKCNDAAVTVNSNNTVDYNMDLTAKTLTFIENTGYQFLYWETSDSNSIKFDANTEVTNKTIKFDVTAPSSSVTVSAYCAPRPVVSSVSPFNADPSTKFDKNTPITITFAQPIKNETKDAILISYTGVNNISKTTYFNTTISGDNKTVTLTPIKMLPVTNDYETVTVTVPHNKVYYLTNDGNTQVLLDDEEDFTWSYRVKDSTMEQTVISLNTDYASSDTIRYNNSLYNSGAAQIVNEQQSVSIEYPIADGYKFLGWKVTAVSGYTVSPSGYVTSGIISVKKSGITYFTLSIPDSQNPHIAVIQSNQAVEKGTNTCALTVFAKDSLTPEITSTTPAYSGGGIECDTPITITFNKAVNKSTVTFSSTGTIQVINSTTEDHYEQYFATPVWDDKTLIITPLHTIRSVLSDSADLKNLKVKIDYTNIKDADGNSLKKDYSWTYRINWNMETDPPVVSDMIVYKPTYTYNPELEKSVENSNPNTQIPFEEFSSWTLAKYKNHHINNKIYFSATVSDSGSGYKQMTIKETLIRTLDGAEVSIEAVPPVDENGVEQNVFSSSTFTKQSYELTSEYDGVVQLDFIFEDNAGNQNTKTYYLVKDTTLDDGVVLRPRFDFIGEDSTNMWGTATQHLETDNGTEIKTLDNLNVGVNAFYIPLNNTSKQNLAKLTSDSSHNLQTILTFNYYACKDIFAKNQSETANYIVKYGYSESSIETTVSISSGKYSFVRDTTKDCYIKISAYDSVGNSKTIIRVIPKQVSIVNMTVDETNSDYVNIIIKDSDYLSSLGRQQNVQKVDYLIYFKYKATEDSEYSNLYPPEEGTTPVETWHFSPQGSIGNILYTANCVRTRFALTNANFTDETLTPDGIYTFYIIPFFKYSETTYYGAVSETSYTYYHNIERTTSSAPTFGAYTIQTQTPVVNEGSIAGTVTTSFTGTTGFTYGLAYNREGETNDQAKLASLNFRIPSGFTWNVFLFAKNDSTGEIFFDSNKKVVDATYDNVPPVINCDDVFYETSPNQIFLCPNTMPHDEGVGLTETEDGLYYTFDYYLIKKNDTTSINHDIITKQDLVGLTPYKAKFEKNAQFLTLDFEKFIDSYYLLVINLKDKNGNESIYTYTISNIIFPQVSRIEYRPNDYFDVKFSYPIGNDGSLQAYFNGTVIFYLTEDGKWTWKEYKHQDNSIRSLSDDLQQKTFYKIMQHSLSNSTYRYDCHAFLSIEYAKKMKKKENVVCANKSMIAGYGNTYQIFYDAPCFAHTMACPSELVADYEQKAHDILTYNTELSYEEALSAVWATKGQEFNCKLINGDSFEAAYASYAVPVSEIPSGYSYVTIAHFADGTSIMSDVKQK